VKQVTTATQDIADWRSLAACMSADPDMFFPISSVGPALQQVSQAKAICAGCRVRQACLDFALSTGQTHGVWGGTTEEERQRLRRHRPASPAAARQAAQRPRRGVRQRARR
jgi:WhiB family redox-sensing transcriptional regulator